MEPFELEVLLPVHNEGESIERTLREIHDRIAPRVRFRFIIREDGSRDDTKEVLRRVSAELPMLLEVSDERKGYSRALVEGMLASSAPYLLSLDSDGQIDPGDFPGFWEARDRETLWIGWRVHRADTALRRAFSWFFRLLHKLLFGVPVHDPSCSLMLMHQSIVREIVPQMREMNQGFQWEFTARVHRAGYRIRELPINHRARAAGETQVYRWSKIPGIGWRHFVALFKIWSQTRGR
jgi:dolichol-phosphate mannosyltransferase